MEGGACIPLRVHTIVISVQHSEDITVEEMRKQLKEKVIKVRGGEISHWCLSGCGESHQWECCRLTIGVLLYGGANDVS